VAAALPHAEALRPLGQVSLVYRAWAEMLEALEQAPSEVSGQAPTEAPGQAQAGAGTAESCLAQGVAQAMEAGSTWQAAGSGGGYAGLMLLQADVCARAGQAAVGLEALDRAQAWIERTGMRALEAEVWRMRGELLLRADEAEACFRRALEVAREQGARWLELRAAASLARLWRAQGQRDEARGLLSDIYGWFTEGFATVDLVEAKALLETLR
jgi:tetratricopeptide (TPR) repeat protein